MTSLIAKDFFLFFSLQRRPDNNVNSEILHPRILGKNGIIIISLQLYFQLYGVWCIMLFFIFG